MNSFILWLSGWKSVKRKLPPENTIVRIKRGDFNSHGYLIKDGIWLDLQTNAMAIDFKKGVIVDYWKEYK